MTIRIAMATAAVALMAPTAMAQSKACGSGGSCAEVHPDPGCDDVACCETVCNFDGFCCDVEWDSTCVELAIINCDFTCGASTTIVMGDNAIDTTGGTTDLDLSGLCDPGPYGDDLLHNVAWYDFTPTEDGLHILSTCNAATFDTRIAVLESCDPATVLACLDDTPGCANYTTTLAATLVGGETYKVVVGGYSAGDAGTGTLTISTGGPQLAAVRRFRTEDGGDGAWYGLYTVPGGLTFDDMRAIANENGEEFVSIHSDAENACYTALRGDGPGVGIAIGLAQDTSAGEPDLGWGWTDGSPLDYEAWLEGEPNNGGGTEHHGELWPAGVWNDRGDDSGWNGYIVRLASSDHVPVANDECVAAAALRARVATPYSTTNAYGATSLGDCGGSELTAHNDVFFSFTAKESALHVFKLCGSSFDSVMGILDGCDGSVLACNDDACGDDASIAIELSSGQSIVLVVGGYTAGSAGSGEVLVEIPAAPITTEAISVNFTGGTFVDGADGGRCVDTDLFPAGADAYATLHWGNLTGADDAAAEGYADAGLGDSPAALPDGTGAPTTAFIAFAVENTWRVISYPSDDTERMRRGYLDSNVVGTISLTVNDVPYEDYDVVVYLSAGGNDRLGSVTANGSDPIYFLTEAANGPGYTFEPLVEATSTTIEDATRAGYAVVTGLSGPTCEIAVRSESGGNVGLAGFQIVAGEGSGCLGDFDGDGVVNGADFGNMLVAWGPGPGCPADLNGDGTVGGADVGLLLSVWGACP